MRDRWTLYAAAALRSVAVGFTGVFLGIHLGRLGLSSASLGSVVGAGLAGGAAAALVATLAGDRIGRRRLLLALAVLGAAGAGAAALVTGPGAFAAAAFVGMLNGMGRDRGAALVLEQAALPGTVAHAARTRTFAVYNAVQDAGHAAGALLGGVPALLVRSSELGAVAAGRASLALVALLSAAALPLYARLSAGIESAPAPGGLSAHGRRVVVRISALFAVDAFGSGLVPTALLSYFARRIGLLNTMVFTHLPSSLLLLTVGVAPDFAVAASLFLLRESLVEMDVPTRQSYVMALVAPGDRTFASGVTNLVRLAAWAVAPAAAGLLMRHSLAAPLVAGAGLKAAYDLALFAAFRRIRPPEES